VRKRRLVLWIAVLLLALNAALFLVRPGLALPRSLGAYFFGPKMVRAEVIMREGTTTRDFRIDQGRIRAVTRDSITLRERDGTLVIVPVAFDAEILWNGQRVTLRSLRRGLNAITVRESGRPAETVRARGR
jgi:hypothetical protein